MVLFKEFQMPESCLKCPFTYVVRPDMMMYCGIKGATTTDAEVGEYKKSRHPDCQMEEYPEPKKEKEEEEKMYEKFELYEEIRSDVSHINAVVIKTVPGHKKYICWTAEGSVTIEGSQQLRHWQNTGRSYPELAKVLEQMKEE